jgi:hyperosmotically inducible periplasmic protein
MKVLAVIGVLALFSLSLFACSHITGKSAGQSLDDSVIKGEINAKILKDAELKTWAIDVASYRGDVTLSGQVPNRAAQQRLIQYAQETKGVKQVRTNLQVAGTSGTEKPASAR